MVSLGNFVPLFANTLFPIQQCRPIFIGCERGNTSPLSRFIMLCVSVSINWQFHDEIVCSPMEMCCSHKTMFFAPNTTLLSNSTKPLRSIRKREPVPILMPFPLMNNVPAMSKIVDAPLNISLPCAPMRTIPREIAFPSMMIFPDNRLNLILWQKSKGKRIACFNGSILKLKYSMANQL